MTICLAFSIGIVVGMVAMAIFIAASKPSPEPEDPVEVEQRIAVAINRDPPLPLREHQAREILERAGF